MSILSKTKLIFSKQTSATAEKHISDYWKTNYFLKLYKSFMLVNSNSSVASKSQD